MSFSRIGILGLLICIPLLLRASEHDAGRPIRFAPLPMEGKKILREQFYGLARYLQERLNRPVELVDFADYNELLEAFREDRIDIAYLGPLPYTLLVASDQDVAPVACFREADGRSSYTCSLIARDEETLDPASVDGLHVGLTQPLSTCGYLAVSQMLRQAGRSLEEPDIRFSYAGSHMAAALGVVRGVYDLAGVKTTIAERYRHLGLQTLTVSRAYPGFGLYANRRRLDATSIARLREVLLALDPHASEAARSLMASWGASLRNGTVDPSHCNDPGLLESIGDLPPPLEGQR